MKYIIANNKKQTDFQHPIDAFLESLAPSLKNLPPYYQHLAKGKIFSVVQEIESQAFFSHLLLQHILVVTLEKMHTQILKLLTILLL